MELEPIVLTDPLIQPTDEIIFPIIGENKVYWEELIEFLYDNYSDISEQWRFYNDGKSWLYRTLRKKKTIYCSKRHLPGEFLVWRKSSTVD